MTHHRYTYAQYVALERDSPTKHEFLDGEIYAMAGGSEDHSALAANTIAALVSAVADRPCRVHTSDLRIYVEAADREHATTQAPSASAVGSRRIEAQTANARAGDRNHAPPRRGVEHASIVAAASADADHATVCS